MKKVYKISGMHCPSCAMMIDDNLENTKGVISANTNYAKEVTEIEFNEKEIQIEKIAEVIKKAGYQIK